MKKIILTLFVLTLASSQAANAQDVQEYFNKRTIIDDLQSNDSVTEGVIRVESDPDITALLGSISSSTSASGEHGYLKMNGFRIQVFSGNEPRKAKAEAQSKESRIKDLFPEVATYVSFDSPNWRVRVGDFRSKEEAVIFMQELKKAFPDFGKEMYTVVDKIRIPVENNDN